MTNNFLVPMDLFNMLQQARNSRLHDQFHEAQRRQKEPQPVIKHRRAKSLLLPAPNNMIFELFNTILKEIPSERLTEYITQNLRDYLYRNWTTKLVRQMIRRLRREQAIDVRAGLTSVPAIKPSTGAQTGSKQAVTIIDLKRDSATKSPQTNSPTTINNNNIINNNNNMNIQSPPGGVQSPTGSRISAGSAPMMQPAARPIINSMSSRKRTVRGSVIQAAPTNFRRQDMVNQVYDHIMWRIQTENVTQVCSLLIKMALDDGYRSGKLKSEAYEDVGQCFEDWRGQKLIKLYAFGSAPPSDQRLLLASTQAGDLTQWIANFIDGSEKRQKPELIRVLAATLRDKSKNCIFITNQLIDAIKSLESGSFRSVFLVDRLDRYEPITSMPNFTRQIEPLIISGKLYVMSSLACVEFAPDPSADTCC